MDRVVRIQTPTGPLSIVREVAARLLKQGVISGDLDGQLHANDAMTVKAAMLTVGVCDFCSAPGPQQVIAVPDFDMPVAGQSTGGWAACDICAELVKKFDRKTLLDRAVDSMAYGKFTKSAIAELHNRFWKQVEATKIAGQTIQQMILFIEDKLPPKYKTTITSRDRRIEQIRRITGLTPREVELMITYAHDPTLQVGHSTNAPIDEWTEILNKVTRWRKTFGQGGALITELLSEHKPLPNIVPHWQTAIDEKFKTLTTLQKLLSASDNHVERFPSGTPVGSDGISSLLELAGKRKGLRSLGFTRDLKMLAKAQVYSFNEETEAAIREAAQSLPHDAPLSAIETPNAGAGWFWFSKPLAIACGPDLSDHTHALLWGWSTDTGKKTYRVTLTDDVVARLDPAMVEKLQALTHPELEFTEITLGELAKELRKQGVTQAELDAMTTEQEPTPALTFSAYARDERGKLRPNEMLPSTRWHWPLNMTFHDMIMYTRIAHRATYGPGTAFEHDPLIIGEEDTVKIVAELSLFFLMSCVWFKQRVSKPPILSREKGHVERHARKRYQREYKLTEEPTVHVVALRKSERAEPAEAPPDRQATAREYHCRWIVEGHPKMQVCGPGRTDRKLIWIDAYPALKDRTDLPLKTKTTVYAVVR